MTGWQRQDLSVPAAHPTASGHFPGRPVIPGALLLDEVAQAIAGNGPLCFRAVKFLAPACHGEPLELRWLNHEDGLVRFEIRRMGQDAAVVTGTLEAAA
jgi:3-hydroxyacyl-[acyl-carrier-protein] dehydratase